jgi:hypothetical protein
VDLENATRDDWVVDHDGWLGILAVIASLAVVADLAIERLSPQTQLPAIGESRMDTRFILAVVAAGFVALKLLFHIHFDLFGWGFYVNVIVTVALVYVAYQARAGGTIAWSGLGGMSGGSRAAAPPPAPLPAAPAEPAGTSRSGGAGAPPSGRGSRSTPPPGS